MFYHMTVQHDIQLNIYVLNVYYCTQINGFFFLSIAHKSMFLFFLYDYNVSLKINESTCMHHVAMDFNKKKKRILNIH